jgi:hypothetical protein
MLNKKSALKKGKVGKSLARSCFWATRRVKFCPSVSGIQVHRVSSISLPLRARSCALVGGAQPIHGWWATVHSAIKRGWGPQLAVRGSPRRRTPHPTNPNPTRGSTGAAGSSATAVAEAFLLDSTYTVPHPPPPDARPHVRDTVVPEPALLPLRQAAAAPATTTCEMASDSALPSNPDGLRPLFPPLFSY